jgi:hypothetical protein
MMTRFIVNHSLLSTLDKLILKWALQSYQVRHRLSRESSRLLRCVHPDDDSSIYQFDHSIGVLSNPRIVRHHDQGHAALAVQFAPRGLVSQDQLGIVDERPGDSDALSFAPRQLRRPPMRFIREPDALKKLARPRLRLTPRSDGMRLCS